MISGLRREVNGLARLGFFKHVPAAAFEIELAGHLFLRARGGDFSTLRKIDMALISARRDAARRGVHCSFAAFPLQNL